MFDSRTMKPLKSIDVGRMEPRHVLFEAFTNRVYVFGDRTTAMPVIDAKEGMVVGSLELGGAPRSGVADGDGTLYVVLSDSSTIAVVDLRGMKVTRRLSLGGNSACHGVALDAANHLLFVTCTRSESGGPVMAILSSDDGRIVSTLSLAGTPTDMVFNPVTKEAFSTHENGTMAVVHEEGPTVFRLVADIDTIDRAKSITLDRKTNRVFTMSDEPGDGSFTVLMIGK
jgi:DNA-binding beta-propeller fold protein YncE